MSGERAGLVTRLVFGFGLISGAVFTVGDAETQYNEKRHQAQTRADQLPSVPNPSDDAVLLAKEYLKTHTLSAPRSDDTRETSAVTESDTFDGEAAAHFSSARQIIITRGQYELTPEPVDTLPLGLMGQIAGGAVLGAAGIAVLVAGGTDSVRFRQRGTLFDGQIKGQGQSPHQRPHPGEAA